MSEHVLDWISAYHDGELHGDRRRRVEAHLRTCAACQAELEGLQDLRVRLQANPPMPARTPPEQFVAQVQLRLGQQPAAASRGRLRQAAGLWLPLGVLGLWALGQAVLAVGGLVLLVLWGASVPPGRDTLAPSAVGVVDLLVLNIALTAVAAGLVWGCLAGWWAARERGSGANLASSGEPAG
jgi:anti-sigma factor RsiW